MGFGVTVDGPIAEKYMVLILVPASTLNNGLRAQCETAIPQLLITTDGQPMSYKRLV